MYKLIKLFFVVSVILSCQSQALFKPLIRLVSAAKMKSSGRLFCYQPKFGNRLAAYSAGSLVAGVGIKKSARAEGNESVAQSSEASAFMRPELDVSYQKCMKDAEKKYKSARPWFGFTESGKKQEEDAVQQHMRDRNACRFSSFFLSLLYTQLSGK